MNIAQWLFPNIFLCEENHDYNKDKIEFKSHKNIDTISKNKINNIIEDNYCNSYSGSQICYSYNTLVRTR